ncbi:retrovirus-related pol polyprotein from transposon TNT 1-94 [Tanacetum coccineum]|uniref:Retrovirus-related pol polyprotein from transposon TNT 1-94 n=1 Tax=Tanacetum coccineum TaxID=301880 RepID=A0ABQ5CP73_9ASTR
MNQFCGMKWIKREFSVARTPQQNGVAERKNRTLIEVARTMLVDSFLPITFWAEAVNTTCYVQNRVLVTNPHNKTPYELLHVRPPSISFMRPFSCPMTILNTLDPLGKFDEGFLVGYSINSKAFRVFNTRTRKVEESLHITFLENKPNVAGSGPDWLFDIDLLTNSMNYKPVTAGNQTNGNACIKDNVDADLRAKLDKLLIQQKEAYDNRTNTVSTVSPSVSATEKSFINADNLPTDPFMPDLEDTIDLLNTSIFSGAYDDEYDHPENSTTQTRRMAKIPEEHAMVEAMQEELLQFRLQKVWTLVDLPNGKRAIGTKWVFRNKKDERGIVVRNKARLVAQGYTQEEGIDYNKVFVPVARIESIRLFLAYASFMGFIVYQMDVKSAFLYGNIEEEVYVCQPPGFEDPQFPNKVYKVYVDDIIFGSTKKSLYVEFKQMMHKKF